MLIIAVLKGNDHGNAVPGRERKFDHNVSQNKQGMLRPYFPNNYSIFGHSFVINVRPMLNRAFNKVQERSKPRNWRN